MSTENDDATQSMLQHTVSVGGDGGGSSGSRTMLQEEMDREDLERAINPLCQ